MPERSKMSEQTRSQLKYKYESEKLKFDEALKKTGAAGGTNDWHDNPEFDEANRQVDLASISLRDLGAFLDDPEIIKPRRDTSNVGIGNTVLLRFEGDPEPEKFNVLGRADAIINRSNISYASPLGSALLGKKPGEKVSFQFEAKSESSLPITVSVEIVKILPGDF